MKAWQDRIKEINRLIEPLENERSQLKQKILESKSEIKIGDIISWNKGKRKGRVIDITPWVTDTPMWKVVNILKNGADGCSCEVMPYNNPIILSKASSKP